MTQTFRVRSMSMGIKRILLKLVDDIPEDTLPTHLQNEQVQFLAFLHTRHWVCICVGQRN
jgi:hypothetical protein